MPGAIDPSRDLDAMMARLGWRPNEHDSEADIAKLVALQGPPQRRVTADAVLAALAGEIAEPRTEPAVTIIPFVNPHAEGLSRAARNGDEIPSDIEQRMQADKRHIRESVGARPTPGMETIAECSTSILTEEREEEIASLAEGIAVSTFGSDRVDLEHLIAAAGLTISRGHYGQAFDGLLEYDGAGFHIYANMDRLTRCDEGRGFFTLGHEFGHFSINEHREWMERNPGRKHPCFLFSSLAKDAPHEREADLFASNLIMPAPSFRKLVGCPSPSAEVILDAARFFGCSVTATAIRFCELEPFPCAIIRWDESGKLLWGRMSPRVRATYGALARDLAGDRAASLTAHALSGGIGAGQEKHHITVSEVWFPWAEDRANRKGAELEHFSAQLSEHVIALGSYGFLTVLCGHEWMKLPGILPGKGRAKQGK